MNSILEVQSLNLSNEGFQILSNITCRIEAGSFTAVVGPNGSGKTSLLKTCCGIAPGTISGSVTLLGQPLQSMSMVERAKRISYVPQRLDGVYPYTVREFLLHSVYRPGILSIFNDQTAVSKKAGELIERLCLEAQSEIALTKISGGEFQRVLIAGALMQDATCLVFDEPTTALDPYQEEIVFQTIEDLRRRNALTIVMSTHNCARVSKHASDVLALKRGRLEYAGSSQVMKDEAFIKKLYGDGTQ